MKNFKNICNKFKGVNVHDIQNEWKKTFFLLNLFILLSIFHRIKKKKNLLMVSQIKTNDHLFFSFNEVRRYKTFKTIFNQALTRILSAMFLSHWVLTSFLISMLLCHVCHDSVITNCRFPKCSKRVSMHRLARLTSRCGSITYEFYRKKGLQKRSSTLKNLIGFNLLMLSSNPSTKPKNYNPVKWN